MKYVPKVKVAAPKASEAENAEAAAGEAEAVSDKAWSRERLM